MIDTGAAERIPCAATVGSRNRSFAGIVPLHI